VAPDGATAIEFNVAFDTVTVVVSETEPTFAVMVELPGATPVSRPDGVIVATAVSDEAQDVTWFVRDRVLPSENVPVIVSCSVVCFAMVELSGLI
jgi:hypothetical protein